MMNSLCGRITFFLLSWGAISGQGICQDTARVTATTEKHPLKPFTAVWGKDMHYPAVCVGKASWFVCSLPAGIPLADMPSAPPVQAGDSKVGTKILHLNREHRICLLETESELPGATPFPLAGQGRIVPGLPLTSLTSGESCHSRVAGKDFEYLGEALPSPLIRIHLESEGDHFCLPGTPLVNGDGEIEGLLSERKLHKDREVHAIPAPVIEKIVWEMKHHQQSGPVWLGITFHTKTTTPEIVKVGDNSPAAEAGIQTGDVVLSINGHAVEGIPDLVELIHSLPAGKPAAFKILRNVDELELEVTPVFASSRKQA